jgi:2-iminobutanoate/2-iminopropanoate deaminase
MTRDDRRQEFRVESLHEPVSHYTDAVRWGDLLFVSGVAPLDKELRLVSEDVVEQTRKVFLNMKEILDAAGASFADVLKVTVFLTDVRDRARINPVRKEFFGAARPASTLIGIKELVVPGMKVEIEAVVGLRRGAA